jgi:hypothetical protein
MSGLAGHMMTEVSLVTQPFIKLHTLKLQLESFLRCENKESVNLVLFSDNAAGTTPDDIAKNEAVMKELQEFADVHRKNFRNLLIHRPEQNHGPYRTCQLALDFALELTDYAIFTEDDTLFASDAFVWFTGMYEGGALDHDDNWAIAGESIFFDAREKGPSGALVERAKRTSIERGFYNKFVPLDFIPSTCFATTRAKWKLFGDVRGRTVGDVALCELCAEKRKFGMFPLLPRVKDIGMLHPDGHSMRIHGADGVRAREIKNTYLMSDDVLASPPEDLRFERFDGDVGALYQSSVLLQGADGAS